jgi:hypothetical protein
MRIEHVQGERRGKLTAIDGGNRLLRKNEILAGHGAPLEKIPALYAQ